MDFNYYLEPITSHYFDFDGATGRKPFWMFQLFNFLITLGLEIVLGVVHLFPLIGLYTLALLLPSLGLAVRRLHDVGKSGWWLLVAFVPLLGVIYLIYLYCQPSVSRQSVEPARVA